MGNEARWGSKGGWRAGGKMKRWRDGRGGGNSMVGMEGMANGGWVKGGEGRGGVAEEEEGVVGGAREWTLNWV